MDAHSQSVIGVVTIRKRVVKDGAQCTYLCAHLLNEFQSTGNYAFLTIIYTHVFKKFQTGS